MPLLDEIDAPTRRATRPRADRLDRLALACAGRLYRDAAGTVWLVRGRPLAIRLFDALKKLSHQFTGLPLEPTMLGFERSQLSPLSPETLVDLRRRCAQVRKLASASSRKHRPWKARHSAALDRIEARLAWAERQVGVPGRPAYLLEAEVEASFDRALRELAGYLPTSWIWMLRLAVWFQGSKSISPLLESLAPHLTSADRFAEIAALVRFESQVQEWKRRARKPVEGETPLQLRARIVEEIRSLPAPLADSGSIDVIVSGLSARALCDFVIRRLSELIRGRGIRLSPAPLAFLVAAFSCDLIERPVRGKWFSTALDNRPRASLRDFLAKLVEEVHRPGYRAMLATLETLPLPPYPDELEDIRKTMQAGATREEIAWLLDRRMSWKYTPATGPTRRLEELARDRGIEFGYTAAMLFNLRGDGELTRAAGDFLERLPRTELRGAAKDAIERVLQTLRIGKPLSAECREAFLALLAEPRGLNVHAAPASVWLARILHHRRQVDPAAVLPRRIGELLEQETRESGERNYLERCAEHGELTPTRRARLELLKSRAETDPGIQTRKKNTRLVAWGMEAYATSADETLAAIVHSKVDAWWKSVVGPRRECVDSRHQAEICNWVQQLKPQPRADLERIFAAWNARRADYRRHLAGNAAWLDQAAGRGLDLASWFAPEPREFEVAGERLRIQRASDPVEILLMGSWFNTCLSLDDTNHASVIANAYDPDKAVLYVWAVGRPGPPIARKLVALSPDDRLLGYSTYFADRPWGDDSWPLSTKRMKIDQDLADYALAWSVRARLGGLSNSGAPIVRKERFWYDDEACAWSGPLVPPAPEVVPLEGETEEGVSALAEAVMTTG